MNDCMYDLYAHTKKPQHLAAAKAFDEEELFDRILSGEENILNNKHANTTLPKILGALNRYKTTGEERYFAVAKTFFQLVAEKHAYVTGGIGEWEHFGRDNVLDADRTNCNAETCVAHNMCKLAQNLFCLTGEKYYLDYYERTFVNSILASVNPESGMTTYFQPMANGYFKVFGSPFDKFWCCTGSGMENFTKTERGVWYGQGNTLYLAMLRSSEVQYNGFTVAITADYPQKKSFHLSCKGTGELHLVIRVPNGAEIDGAKDGVLSLDIASDTETDIAVIPKMEYASLPDNPDVYAFSYGGVVLAADLGQENMETAQTGVLVTIPKHALPHSDTIVWKKGKEDFFANFAQVFQRKHMTFLLPTKTGTMRFTPYYRQSNNRYGIYWHISDRMPEEKAERQKVDTVQPGYGQYENDELHSMRSVRSVGCTSDGTCRFAQKKGWFAYDMRILPGVTNTLAVCFRREDFAKTIEIRVGNTVISADVLLFTGTEERPWKYFTLSEELLERESFQKEVEGNPVPVVTVRFAGLDGKQSARISDFIYILAD